MGLVRGADGSQDGTCVLCVPAAASYNDSGHSLLAVTAASPALDPPLTFMISPSLWLPESKRDPVPGEIPGAAR